MSIPIIGESSLRDRVAELESQVGLMAQANTQLLRSLSNWLEILSARIDNLEELTRTRVSGESTAEGGLPI